MTTLERVIKATTIQLGMPDGDVTASKTFVYDLDMDSLDTIEVLMAIEEEFDIEIQEQNITPKCEGFTVQDAADMVDSLITPK